MFIHLKIQDYFIMFIHLKIQDYFIISSDKLNMAEH